MVEGDAFLAGDGVESELGIRKVAGGEGVVAGGEAALEGGGEGFEAGVGVDAVEGMGAGLGGLDIVDPPIRGAGEGVAAGLGADIVAEADLAVGELGEGGGAEDKDEETDDADDKLDHRLSAASAIRCATGGLEAWRLGGLGAGCLRLDCQGGEPQIPQIKADLWPVAAGWTARIFRNCKGHKGRLAAQECQNGRKTERAGVRGSWRGEWGGGGHWPV